MAPASWPAALEQSGSQIRTSPRPEPCCEGQGLERKTAAPPVLSEEARGDLLMAHKQFSEAAAAYQEALRKDPRNAVLLNKIGIAYHQMLRFGEAKKYYERALKADKNYAYALNNLGTIEYNHKKYRKAVRYYQRALKIQSDVPSVLSNLGYAYFAEKKYEDALSSFQRALEFDPQVFENKSLYGSVVQDRSVADRALFYFFLAKSFASRSDAEQCAHYLRKARDEGYKDLAAVAADPAFASVLQDPRVQEVLQPSRPERATNPPGA
jgi:tetratricopeptide (TPR) repeat protein